MPAAELELSSFDGGVRRKQRVVRPDRYRALEAFAADEVRTVRGGGYSYAAASFGADATIVDARAFDRCLAIDEASGTVECEAGMSLGKLHAVATQRSLFMPVQPGYPRITIGGCIAGDVHGKNHHKDGNFRHRVRSLVLFHPAHGALTLSREQHPQLFELTCGGFGLTGQILSATLVLERLSSRAVRLARARIERVQDTVARLEELGPCADLAYTWQDFTATGAAFGRGFLYAGTFAAASASERDANSERRETTPRRGSGDRRSVDEQLGANGPRRVGSERGSGEERSVGRERSADEPSGVDGQRGADDPRAADERERPIDSTSRARWRLAFFNRATTRAFNWAYAFAQGAGAAERDVPLFDFLFPVARKVVYYELFGARGLHEYQVLLPTNAFGEFASRVKSAIARHRMPITLASCKLFRGEQRLLRFDGAGVCIALDFPRSHKTGAFAAELDEALLACRGVPNIMKDSRLPRTVVERAYPEHALFRERLRAFDPKRLYRSEISERLGL